MKKKIAIIGSGISAMTCAYNLQDDYDVSIFEKNDYLGGHTHTHELQEEGKSFKVDTGFIVFNQETYPNLIKMFADLGVERQASNMSFSVYNKLNNLQYASEDLSHLFAQRKNFISIRFWKFILEIKRFFKIALAEKDKILDTKESIQEYCIRHNLSLFFIDNYLVPMSAAIWSTPQERAYDFPIALLLPFFHNHGLLNYGRQFQWYTVKGGSNTYIKKIVAENKLNINLQEKVKSVHEKEGRVVVETTKNYYDFDFAVLASHADESLALVRNLSQDKKDLLSLFTYNFNTAVLHTDESIMPPNKKAWASWNQIMERDKGRSLTSTIYWMNRLQKLPVKTNYFVSLNPFQKIEENKIIKKVDYYHPNFTTENFARQKDLSLLNQNTKIFFAGAYFGYGFHEDGAKVGLEVARELKNLK